MNPLNGLMQERRFDIRKPVIPMLRSPAGSHERDPVRKKDRNHRITENRKNPKNAAHGLPVLRVRGP